MSEFKFWMMESSIATRDSRRKSTLQQRKLAYGAWDVYQGVSFTAESRLVEAELRREARLVRRL